MNKKLISLLLILFATVGSLQAAGGGSKWGFWKKKSAPKAPAAAALPPAEDDFSEKEQMDLAQGVSEHIKGISNENYSARELVKYVHENRPYDEYQYLSSKEAFKTLLGKLVAFYWLSKGECNICLEPFEKGDEGSFYTCNSEKSRVYQGCITGAICSDCTHNLKKCPFCRGDHPKGTSTFKKK